MKKFIDDISVLAIEQCLLTKLPSLFGPDVVYEFTDDEISEIAGEKESAVAERAQLTEKLLVLQSGLNDLKRLDKYHLGASHGSHK